MKIVVFGASGGIGKHVVEQAPARGHQVSAVYRGTPAIRPQVNLRIEHLTDFFSAPALAKIVAGIDAVISCVGPRRANPKNPWSKITSPLDLMSRFSGALIEAMSRSGSPKRVALVSAAGVGPSAPLMNPLLRFVFDHSNVGLGYQDLAKMEEKIEQSGLDWTLVQLTTLTTGPRLGSVRFCRRYGLTNSISRTDVAGFLLDCLVTPERHRSERVMICTK